MKSLSNEEKKIKNNQGMVAYNIAMIAFQDDFII